MYARTTIAGNLGRDAETRQVGQNTVHNFTVAVNRTRKGEKTTTWYRVAAWGDRWTGVLPYLKQGTGVIVDGDQEIREYEANDGTVRMSIDLTANSITLLPRASNNDDNEAPEKSNDDEWGALDF